MWYVIYEHFGQQKVCIFFCAVSFIQITFDKVSEFCLYFGNNTLICVSKSLKYVLMSLSCLVHSKIMSLLSASAAPMFLSKALIIIIIIFVLIRFLNTVFYLLERFCNLFSFFRVLCRKFRIQEMNWCTVRCNLSIPVTHTFFFAYFLFQTYLAESLWDGVIFHT